jgi:hypothetical protein
MPVLLTRLKRTTRDESSSNAPRMARCAPLIAMKQDRAGMQKTGRSTAANRRTRGHCNARAERVNESTAHARTRLRCADRG